MKQATPDAPVPAGLVQSPSGPRVLEGPGRYVVYEAPDGGWVISRASMLCGSCRGCGCGRQAEPITIPAMVIALAKRQGLGRLTGMLRGVAGRG
jgi:hypothetical protein